MKNSVLLKSVRDKIATNHEHNQLKLASQKGLQSERLVVNQRQSHSEKPKKYPKYTQNKLPLTALLQLGKLLGI